MNEIISFWLIEQGVGSEHLASATLIVGLALIALIASVSFYLTKFQLLKVVK